MRSTVAYLSPTDLSTMRTPSYLPPSPLPSTLSVHLCLSLFFHPPAGIPVCSAIYVFRRRLVPPAREYMQMPSRREKLASFSSPLFPLVFSRCSRFPRRSPFFSRLWFHRYLGPFLSFFLLLLLFFTIVSLLFLLVFYRKCSLLGSRSGILTGASRFAAAARNGYN